MSEWQEIGLEFKFAAQAEEIARLSADRLTLTIHLDKMPGGCVIINYPAKSALWSVEAPPAERVEKTGDE